MREEIASFVALSYRSSVTRVFYPQKNRLVGTWCADTPGKTNGQNGEGAIGLGPNPSAPSRLAKRHYFSHFDRWPPRTQSLFMNGGPDPPAPGEGASPSNSTPSRQRARVV